MTRMTHTRLSLAAAAAALALTLVGANLSAPAKVLAQSQLYKSCQEDKLTEPLKLEPASAATEAAAATMAATEAAANNAPADIVFLSIVGSESEACYLASETFLENNMMNLPSGFNGAVGITKTIQGDIALDRANVANSQIGDITINISEFKSDNGRRDSFIRQNFLQSNKYPFATLTNVTAIGLPTGAYQEGTTLEFKIKGTLTVHDTPRDTTFDATGTFKDNVLVVRATTDLKISDFKVQVPSIGGLLKVDDPVRLVVNLVARPSEGTPTPAK